MDEAQAECSLLRTIDSKNLETCCKKAETFSYLGDDAAVLDALKKAKPGAQTRIERSTGALLYHLAAVASARQGNERRARNYWRKALELDPDQVLAKENQDDLDRPVSEREGPWAYTIDYWLPKHTVDQFCETLNEEDCPSAESAQRLPHSILRSKGWSPRSWIGVTTAVGDSPCSSRRAGRHPRCSKHFAISVSRDAVPAESLPNSSQRQNDG